MAFRRCRSATLRSVSFWIAALRAVSASARPPVSSLTMLTLASMVSELLGTSVVLAEVVSGTGAGVDLVDGQRGQLRAELAGRAGLAADGRP